jgi:hypothetical protein
VSRYPEPQCLDRVPNDLFSSRTKRESPKWSRWQVLRSVQPIRASTNAATVDDAASQMVRSGRHEAAEQPRNVYRVFDMKNGTAIRLAGALSHMAATTDNNS